MTKEEKELLLMYLCAMLPYKLHCMVFKLNGDIKENDDVLYGVIGDNVVTLKSDKDECLMYYQIKPYLRPMSSMTEEERKEYKDMNVLDNCDEFSNIKKNIEDIKKNGEENYIQLPRTHAQDYLNSIHVDYRGLIPMGLALEAPEGMYNTKTD